MDFLIALYLKPRRKQRHNTKIPSFNSTPPTNAAPRSIFSSLKASYLQIVFSIFLGLISIITKKEPLAVADRIALR
jgi:hypothetical protein